MAIHLLQNNRVDSLSHFGVHPDALDDYGPYDIPSPPIPPNGNYLRATFYHPEWGVPGLRRFNDDIKSSVPVGEQKTWAFAIMSSSDGEVSVTAESDDQRLFQGYEGFMEYEGQQIDLFSGESLQFEYTGHDTIYVNTSNMGFQQTVTLLPNYFNLVSFSLIPSALDVEVAFGAIEDVVIIYSETGGMVIPSLYIDTIEEIDPTRGYKLFTSSGQTWELEGTLHPEDQNYQLTAGRWNYLGHPYLESFPVEQALGEIAESIVIVQSDQGELWIPDINLNTLINLEPGQGYFVFPSGSIEFTFPFE